MNLEDFRNTGKEYGSEDAIGEKISDLEIKKSEVKNEAINYYSLEDQYRNEIERNERLKEKIEKIISGEIEFNDPENTEKTIEQFRRSLDRIKNLKERFKNLTKEEEEKILEIEQKLIEIDEKIFELEAFIGGFENDFGLRKN